MKSNLADIHPLCLLEVTDHSVDNIYIVHLIAYRQSGALHYLSAR